MDTKYVFFYESRQWHIIECAVDALEDGVRFINVLFEFTYTLITKAHVFVNFFVFVSSSQKMHILRIFQLESEEQQNQLKAT
jgi:hypothetical protein